MKITDIKVIVTLLEGIKDGAKFVAAIQRAAANGKPVIAFKVGKSEYGQRAAQSHTASLTGSAFDHADARGADFSGADLTGVRLNGGRFDRASFHGAELTGASLAGASFDGADFSGADLEHATIAAADLSHARGLNQDQLDDARGDARTRLPPGLTARPCTGKLRVRIAPLIPPAPPVPRFLADGW